MVQICASYLSSLSLHFCIYKTKVTFYILRTVGGLNKTGYLEILSVWFQAHISYLIFVHHPYATNCTGEGQCENT